MVNIWSYIIDLIFFSDRSRDLAIATNFRGKMGEIDLFIRRLAFQNGVEYRNSVFKRFICDDLATSYKNSVNFRPVNPEIKEGERRSSLVDQQFGYVRLATLLLCRAGYTLGSATHF